MAPSPLRVHPRPPLARAAGEPLAVRVTGRGAEGVHTGYEDVFDLPGCPGKLLTDEGRMANSAFLRNPEEPMENVEYGFTYLTNLEQAIRESFLPSLAKGRLASTYVDDLRAQHRVLMQDYRGFYRGAPNVRTEGGVFTHEQGVGQKNVFAQLDTVPRPGSLDPSAPDYRYRIEGLPPEAWPQVRGGNLLVSPAREQMPRVLEHLGKLLEKAAQPLQSQREFENALADYLYVGTLAAPFPRGNVSLLMAHLNILRFERGLPMLPVRRMDLDVLFTGQESFREVARARFNEAPA